MTTSIRLRRLCISNCSILQYINFFLHVSLPTTKARQWVVESLKAHASNCEQKLSMREKLDGRTMKPFYSAIQCRIFAMLERSSKPNPHDDLRAASKQPTQHTSGKNMCTRRARLTKQFHFRSDDENSKHLQSENIEWKNLIHFDNGEREMKFKSHCTILQAIWKFYSTDFFACLFACCSISFRGLPTYPTENMSGIDPRFSHSEKHSLFGTRSKNFRKQREKPKRIEYTVESIAKKCVSCRLR